MAVIKTDASSKQNYKVPGNILHSVGNCQAIYSFWKTLYSMHLPKETPVTTKMGCCAGRWGVEYKASKVCESRKSHSHTHKRIQECPKIPPSLPKIRILGYNEK